MIPEPTIPITGGNHEQQRPIAGSHQHEELLVVADLLALGYRLPGILDDPANGGNDDGFVCGVAMGNRLTPRGNQLYLFSDNQFFPGP